MIDISFFNVPDGHKLGVWTYRADALYVLDNLIAPPFNQGDILLLRPDGVLQEVGNVTEVFMPSPGDEVLKAMDWLTE